MPDLVTLSDLKLGARRICDRENDDTIEPGEEAQHVNHAIQWVTRQLVKAYGPERFWETKVLTTDGSESYELPDDFWMIAMIERQFSGTDRKRLHPFMLGDASSARGSSGTDAPRYRLLGDSITFLPVPPIGHTINVHYIPTPRRLYNDQDTWNCVAGWDELAMVDIAIRYQMKVDDDASALVMRRQALLEDLRDLAHVRDIGEPECVQEEPYFEDY